MYNDLGYCHLRPDVMYNKFNKEIEKCFITKRRIYISVKLHMINFMKIMLRETLTEEQQQL
jgi:hypothetical protein